MTGRNENLAVITGTASRLRRGNAGPTGKVLRGHTEAIFIDVWI